MENIITTSAEQTFKQFLFNNQRNRILLYLAAAAIVLQFAIFKYLYPFASYIHGDSFSYINAAYENMTINTYLVGYSKFLRLVSIFAKPDYILVAIQYMLIQNSVLFLLFTIFYFYKPGLVAKIFLLCFMVLNPLFLHLANMVSSDGLFLSLSSIWFTLLLWIIHKPSNKIIIWQSVVLFLAFTVRYNALIYPIITVLAFSLSKLPMMKKIAGIGLGFILCGSFVVFTMWRYKQLTGYWQYSPFSGWQLANNSMYMYKHIRDSDRKPVPSKFNELDTMIRHFLDNNTRIGATTFPIELNEASTVYMWSPGMPLMNYRNKLFQKREPRASEFKKWSSMGPFYKEYGSYLIKNNLWNYVLYFASYNARKYYAPPVEFLQDYNSNNDEVSLQTKEWFGYKSTKVRIRMDNKRTWILNFYPILSGIINLIMLFGLAYYLLLKRWHHNSIFKKTIILAGSVWLINAGFTIFASSAALRFQSFPIILTTTFSILLIDWMVQLMKTLKLEQNRSSALKDQYLPEVIA